MVVLQILLVHVLVSCLREVVALKRLQSLVIVLCWGVGVAVVLEVVAKRVKIRIISWINHLTEISLPPDLLSLRVGILLMLCILSISIFRKLVKAIVRILITKYLVIGEVLA